MHRILQRGQVIGPGGRVTKVPQVSRYLGYVRRVRIGKEVSHVRQTALWGIHRVINRRWSGDNDILRGHIKAPFSQCDHQGDSIGTLLGVAVRRVLQVRSIIGTRGRVTEVPLPAADS